MKLNVCVCFLRLFYFCPILFRTKTHLLGHTYQPRPPAHHFASDRDTVLWCGWWLWRVVVVWCVCTYYFGTLGSQCGVHVCPAWLNVWRILYLHVVEEGNVRWHCFSRIYIPSALGSPSHSLCLFVIIARHRPIPIVCTSMFCFLGWKWFSHSQKQKYEERRCQEAEDE